MDHVVLQRCSIIEKEKRQGGWVLEDAFAELEFFVGKSLSYDDFVCHIGESGSCVGLSVFTYLLFGPGCRHLLATPPFAFMYPLN